MNRAEFLARQLRYYADVGCDHTVYVGDSSMGAGSEAVSDEIERLKDRLTVVYVRMGGANDYQAVSGLLKLVREPYAAFVADDDFLVPGSLEKCERFLHDHPDYEGVHGNGILFSLETPGPYGAFRELGNYEQGSLEHGTASLRLNHFLSSYWSYSFSIRRTADYQTTVEAAVDLPDKAFRELLVGCLSMIRGRVKKLGCLYLIRQGHPSRYFLPDSYDWITGRHWLTSYEAFRDLLVKELVGEDRITPEEAREVVKRAFWSYLAAGLSAKWQARYAQNGHSLYARLREKARGVPGSRSAWRKVWSFLPGQNDFTLERLLRPSSPYYEDFMPVYRVITTPPGEYIAEHP